MFQALAEIQRDIYLALADQIKLLAADGQWPAFIAFLPIGVFFGAIHALTPGHNKTLLATYLVGAETRLSRGLLMSLATSFTHVTSAVIIAALSLPLVSVALGSVGRAPLLEGISRGLLALIGAWMIWRALRRGPHPEHEAAPVGVIAGLIPCPLTLFVMAFAIARGVPAAGLLFAGTMFVGVGIVLACVAMLSIIFRDRLTAFLKDQERTVSMVSRSIEAAAGMIIILLAYREVVA